MTTRDVCKTQLFLDDEIIEQTVRLQRVIHQPQKHPLNPLYTVGAPWEGEGMVYLGGVYIDPKDQLWKAWYATLYPPAYPEITFAICLITSSDGIQWERPELDVYRGHNGEKTNIVLDMGKVGGTCAPTIIYEPEHEPTPWTLIISSAVYGSWDYKAYILRSADGVHWEWERPQPNGIAHGMGDRCTALKGPDPEYPYLLLSRGLDDIRKWGLVRSVHRVAINSERAQGQPTRVLTPDLADDPAGQIYHAHGFRYGDTYVGLFQWYWETTDPYAEMELITSRDTITWHRLSPRQAFLPRSPGGAAVGLFDCQATDTALSPPIRTTKPGGMETLWLYYWGGQAMHGNRHLTYGRGLGLAQLRADGFCSLRAHRFPGTLVTKPFVWPGGELHVNASVVGGGGNGGLWVEVLTEDLEPISGLTREDADVFQRDSTQHVYTWQQDAGAINTVTGQRVRLKFFLEHVDLYSFRCQPER
ncbi:MAG: hypothetical protein CMJ87_04335 [Planctomycetes bacterium]|nr:hypothetical protein [Planctomycetota bacterium]